MDVDRCDDGRGNNDGHGMFLFLFLFLFLSHRAQVETIPEKNPETEVLEEAHCKNLMPTSKKKENNIIIAYRCTW